MITKKVYEEEVIDGFYTEYVLQLGDFIIRGCVDDNPKYQFTCYRGIGVSARRDEYFLKKYPENEGREAGPEYERIFQILIDNAFNCSYWKYLGKYGRKAVEHYKNDSSGQVLKPKYFDISYNRIPDDVKKYNIQPMEDDGE